MSEGDEVAVYRCLSCGHSFFGAAPLFSPARCCEVQGCSGVALPDQEVKPSGIEVSQPEEHREDPDPERGN